MSIVLAKQNGSFVIVMPHWGEEYKFLPNQFQREWARKFIDNGADVVLGAHPHVVETSEIYKEKPIFNIL